MADKRILISLRVDTGRIRELAPLYQETVVTGEEPVAIVAPAGNEFARSPTRRGG